MVWGLGLGLGFLVRVEGFMDRVGCQKFPVLFSCFSLGLRVYG